MVQRTSSCHFWTGESRFHVFGTKKILAVVAKTEPAPESVAAKRTPQVDLAAPKVVQIVKTSLSLDMSQVHPFVRARAKMLTYVNLFQLAAAR